MRKQEPKSFYLVVGLVVVYTVLPAIWQLNVTLVVWLAIPDKVIEKTTSAWSESNL